MGYQVLIASHPKDAIELVQNQPVDIAVLDIKMPEMDGYRLITALRKVNAELPVVFLTGKQDLDTTFRTFQVKSNGLIENPCLQQQLDFQLRRIIESTRNKAA
jgi:DNA-binding response OmpR family regulator